VIWITLNFRDFTVLFVHQETALIRAVKGTHTWKNAILFFDIGMHANTSFLENDCIKNKIDLDLHQEKEGRDYLRSLPDVYFEVVDSLIFIVAGTSIFKGVSL
jgi:hypothetical protein